MNDDWNVLVVDDEDDVHAVTRLALKAREWRARRFSIVSATTGEQARQILADSPHRFQVAIIDVVMETDHSGLDLCDYIRSKMPPTLRIILRTGQPGVAPEQRVMDDFEIDHYLAKVDATAERIYALVRSCVRTSIEVGLILSFADQQHAFAKALEVGADEEQLDSILRKSLDYLRWKHRIHVDFHSMLPPPGNMAMGDDAASAERRAKSAAALLKAHEASFPAGVLHEGSVVGLPADTVFWIDSFAQPAGPAPPAASGGGGLLAKVKRMFSGDERRPPVRFGYVIELPKDILASPKLRDALARDIAPLTDNWKTARRVVSAEQDVARLRAATQLALMAESDS